MSETESIRYRALVLLEKSEDGDLKGKLIDVAILSLVLLNVLAVVMESVSSIFTRYELYFITLKYSVWLSFPSNIFCVFGRMEQSMVRIGISNGSLRYALSFMGLLI